MSGPDISVVMSVYNNADTLSAALESILSQKGVELEFIVIDDGSDDGSESMLDDMATRDSRLKVVHKRNAGLTCALIDGCALASAPWIARQDADDVSLPGRLRAQLDRVCRPDAPVLVGCGVLIRAPMNEVMGKIHPPLDPDDAKRHLLDKGQAISSHGAILFSRAAYYHVGGYRAPFYYAQDIDLTTRLAEAGPVTAVASMLYEYHYSAGTISGQHDLYQRAFYALIRRAYELRRGGQSDDPVLQRADILKQRCRRIRTARRSPFGALYFIGSCLLRSAPDRALAYFRLAWLAHPWSMKALVRMVQSRFYMRCAKR